MQEGRGTDRLHLGSNVLEVRDDCPSGVIYRPETERISHYFGARITEQFDTVIHVDTTQAVEPLDAISDVVGEEIGCPRRFHRVYRMRNYVIAIQGQT